MGQSVDCPIFQFISGKTGSLAFRRFSRVYSFRILAVSSHRLLFGSSGLPYCGKLAHPRYVALLHNRAMIPSFAPIKRGLTMQSPFNWSEIDGITHIVFLSCSFAIRDIFFFAHYGSLQVRQVCARRKLAHPVHFIMHRCVIPLSPPQKKSRSGSFSVAERVGFEPTKPFMGAYTISSRARSTGLRHLSNFGCLSIIHYFTPIVKRLS